MLRNIACYATLSCPKSSRLKILENISRGGSEICDFGVGILCGGVIYFAGGLQIANVTALSILLVTYTNKENYQQLGDVKFILKKRFQVLLKLCWPDILT